MTSFSEPIMALSVETLGWDYDEFSPFESLNLYYVQPVHDKGVWFAEYSVANGLLL